MCFDYLITVLSVVIGILAGIYLSSVVSLLPSSLLYKLSKKKKKTFKPEALVTW